MNQQNSVYPSAQPNIASGMMSAFAFTADDLTANRMGTATEKQLAQIKATRGQWQGQIVKIIGVMVLIAAGYIAITPQGAQIREVVSQNPTVAIVGIGVTLVLYLIMLGYVFIKSRRMTSSKVNNVSGQFKSVGNPVQALGGEIYQRVKIGKREFFVTELQAMALTPGATYNVYFMGSGQMVQIVSVEPSSMN